MSSAVIEVFTRYAADLEAIKDQLDGSKFTSDEDEKSATSIMHTIAKVLPVITDETLPESLTLDKITKLEGTITNVINAADKLLGTT